MPVGELWTDTELEAALEAYLYVLRLEQAGVQLREHELVEGLHHGPLSNRNLASIRYRLRNISSVLQKIGSPTISTYPPAAKVGTGVESRLLSMLPSAAFGAPFPSTNEPVSARTARKRAIDSLNGLAEALHALDANMIGLGHNNPPEEIEPGTLRGELRAAGVAVQKLIDEVSALKPQSHALQEGAVEIAKSGAGWAAWFGARGTLAADTAIKNLVPVALFGLALLVLKAVSALTAMYPNLFF